MPDNRRRGTGSSTRESTLELSRTPLLSNRPGGVPPKSRERIGPSKHDTEVAVDLRPESISRRDGSSTDSDVNLRERARHAPGRRRTGTLLFGRTGPHVGRGAVEIRAQRELEMLKKETRGPFNSPSGPSTYDEGGISFPSTETSVRWNLPTALRFVPRSCEEPGRPNKRITPRALTVLSRVG